MKLRNKETGEIVEITMPIKNGDDWNISANSLAELNKDWEDYEEPKWGFYIKENGSIGTLGAIEDDIPDKMLSEMKEIGNHFETEEETEKAVEKQKAWTRLMHKGFRFTGWYSSKEPNAIRIYAELPDAELGPIVGSDLDLLFGGKE